MSVLLGFDPVPYVVKDLSIKYKNGESGPEKSFYDGAAVDGNGSDYTSFTLSPSAASSSSPANIPAVQPGCAIM